MPYGNSSKGVQAFVRLFGVMMMNVGFIFAAIAMIVGDFYVVGRFFHGLLDGVSNDQLFAVGGISISVRAFVAASMSFVATAVKVAVFNLLKSGKLKESLRTTNYHRFSVFAAVAVVLLDVLAIVGGTWTTMTGQPGLPTEPTSGQTVTMVFATIIFVAYIPLLDAFAGMDRPSERRLRSVKGHGAA